MSTTIQVTDLQQGYGKTVVLKAINLNVHSGEILGLIGPSGAGKTTLVSTIMGMLKPQKGSVTVLGQKMPNRELLAKIGFMAQTDALYEALTGRENLDFFTSMQGISKTQRQKEISYASGIVDLDTDLDKYVKDYSGGMKRRLSLAIALASNPELLVLDEPTVGIDPELRQQIWIELHKLAQQGKTIILTTHVMADAEQSDQLMMIRDGQAIAQGTPKALMKTYHVNSVEAVFLKAGQMQDENRRHH